MKSQIFRRFVYLAAAILLFVIASQCPYSPYGPLAMNANECFSSKQIENSIISTTSVTADLRQATGPPPRGRRFSTKRLNKERSSTPAPASIRHSQHDTLESSHWFSAGHILHSISKSQRYGGRQIANAADDSSQSASASSTSTRLRNSF